MATTAWIYKAKQPPKFSTRSVRRCNRCGRSRAVYRKFRQCVESASVSWLIWG